MRIIVFGFEKFGGLSSNPSQLVVEELAREDQAALGCQLITCVLPTEYAASVEKINRLISENNPSIVLGLGVASSRQTVCLERFALNIDDAVVKDNAGFVRVGEEIEPGGPEALITLIDLPSILKSLTDQDIPATISNHAGTYVCNHVYYQVLRKLQVENTKTGCVFVHLPGVGGQTTVGINSENRWGIPDLVKAIKLVITGLVKLQDSENGRGN